jgi:hypothetical protein
LERRARCDHVFDVLVPAGQVAGEAWGGLVRFVGAGADREGVAGLSSLLRKLRGAGDDRRNVGVDPTEIDGKAGWIVGGMKLAASRLVELAHPLTFDLNIATEGVPPPTTRSSITGAGSALELVVTPMIEVRAVTVKAAPAEFAFPCRRPWSARRGLNPGLGLVLDSRFRRSLLQVHSQRSRAAALLDLIGLLAHGGSRH